MVADRMAHTADDIYLLPGPFTENVSICFKSQAPQTAVCKPNTRAAQDF